MANRFKKCFNSTYDYLKERGVTEASFGLILGTGMGPVTDIITDSSRLPYDDIPHFPKTDSNLHKGHLVWGKIGDKKVLCMDGRYHYYEGYTMREICYPVYVLHRLGVKHLIITSAVGGICKDYAKGDLVLVKDHINLCSANPLIGMRDENGGIVFPNMLDAYDKGDRKTLGEIAVDKKIDLKEGVLAFLPGPNFETKAELQNLSNMGVDLVGWSMVPEVLMSRALNMRTIGICCVSDLSCPETVVPADLDEIVSVCNEASGRLSTLIYDAVDKLN